MKLLFLCTGNACRSQMAEGWARTLAGDKFEVYSAGIEAHGLNPRAVAVMQEADVDISGQESTRLSEEMFEQMDYVVTVCGHADELCPALPPGVRKEHWPLTDPAKAEGSEDDIIAVFRHSRDDIKQRVQKLIERLTKESAA